MKKLLASFLGLSMLVGCSSTSKTKTSDQLLKECASGVVLIYNKYYYQIELPTGQTLYMAGISEDGTPNSLTMDKDEIKKHPNGMFGTGFFIDKKGHILTNRHVVKGVIDESTAQELIVNSMRRERQAYLDSMRMADNAYEQLKNRISECYTRDVFGNVYLSNENLLQQINEGIEYLREAYYQWKELSDFLAANSSASNVKITIIPEIGIAYNDTHVNDENDFFGENSCVIRKVSNKENTDLAVIQLKKKATPEFAHIFDTSGIVMREKESKSIGELMNEILFGEPAMEPSESEELKIGQQLYIIGYNHGMQLAQTQEGIMAQMTEGKITQLPDGERLLYSIPTMQGSSGSPVIDEEGNLRGVNFAKATLSDNFNFGIPMNLVKTFLKE